MYNYNYVDISFATLPKSTGFLVTDLRYEQTRYGHETMSVNLRNWNLGINAFKTGTPVQVTLRGPITSRTFVGYVHHAKAEVSPTSNYIELNLIGASLTMKQQEQKVWRNMTASDVVQNIAKKHGFSYEIDPTTRVFPQIAQSGMSDWAFCVKLAKQHGYAFRVENTTLYFEKLTKRFTSERENAPIYNIGTMSKPTVTKVYSFNPVVGESIPFNDSRKAAIAVHGTDSEYLTPHSYSPQAQGKTFRNNYSAPVFDRHDVRTVAPSFAIAKQETEAAQELTRYPYRATAELLGDPSIKVDRPIYIDGADSEYSGHWVVLSAEHHVREGKYTTHVELGTDSLGQATTWTDGKKVTAPNTVGKRTLVEGILNGVKVETSALLNTGNQASTFIAKSLGLVKNQPAQKVNNQKVPTTRWVSAAGNLTPVQSKSNTPPAVLKRLANVQR